MTLATHRTCADLELAGERDVRHITQRFRSSSADAAPALRTASPRSSAHPAAPETPPAPAPPSGQTTTSRSSPWPTAHSDSTRSAPLCRALQHSTPNRRSGSDKASRALCNAHERAGSARIDATAQHDSPTFAPRLITRATRRELPERDTTRLRKHVSPRNRTPPAKHPPGKSDTAPLQRRTSA